MITPNVKQQKRIILKEMIECMEHEVYVLTKRIKELQDKLAEGKDEPLESI